MFTYRSVQEPASVAVQPASAGKHIPVFDGLRGLAVLSIFVLHWSMYVPALRHSIDEARAGVDLFFVLSGFLITRILLDAKSKSGYFRQFWRRRALRILPLAIAFYLVVQCLHSFSSERSEFQPWWLLTFFQNWWIGSHELITPKHITITWSLAIEEQYYMLWPMLVFVCWRQRLVLLTWLMLLASPFMRVWVSQYWGYPEIYFWTICRLDGLAGGVLALSAMQDSPRLRVWMGSAAVPSAMLWGIGQLTGLWTWSIWLYSLKFSVIAMTFACVVVALLNGQLKPLNQVCLHKGLAHLGRISFSLYMWHQLIFMFAHRVVTATWGVQELSSVATGLSFTVIGVPFALVFAHLSYRCIEEPFLKLK